MATPIEKINHAKTARANARQFLRAWKICMAGIMPQALDLSGSFVICDNIDP